ncbi:hypothetical protein BXZ70DRAFT_937097 [Cristinia sonorae]|uniref:Nucleoporin nup45 n=1 Tax=Cristinia sonorae TaxID=1940300 RepID=A0A8K0UQ36_9AGAR|nr:hypothetical protein BXZ70DRAFT_937097 [Cristinia sonorae]
MSFGSGTSLFGQKPATNSVFGSQTQNPGQSTTQQGSMFGNSVPNISTFGAQNQTQPTQGSNLFGGQQQQNQAPQPIQPPTLFGQTPQNNAPQTGGGLFGNSQQTQQNTTSNLFSQPAAQTQANTTQPGGFGSTPSNTTGSSLFGGASTTGSSLFGNTSANTQNSGSNLFGSTTATQNAGTNLFGNTSTNAQNSGSNLFGNASTNTGSNLFGGTSTNTNQPFGAASTNQNPLFGNRQQSQPAMSFSTSATPGAPAFTKSTRFNDLPDWMKKTFEDIDSHIQGRIQICNNLKQRKLGDEANKGKELIRDVHKDLLHTISVIQSDLLQTRAFKEKSDQTVKDAIVTVNVIDGYGHPQQGNVQLNSHAEFPLQFFTRSADEMKEKLSWCKNTIEAIERKLSSIASQSQVTPQAITTTLEAQHTTFITLASRTAAVDAELQKVKSLYTQLWRAKTGSVRDPFNDLDRGAGNEFGLEGLSTGRK